MKNAFIRTLEQIASKNKDVFFVTGDLGFAMIESYQKNLPRQFVNAGVSEQNMMGFAAGMSLTGKTVFTYSIATFSTFRCLEQIRNDVCYHNANVKIVANGAGFSYGGLGVTHHLTEDMAIMRALPGMRVLSPANAFEAEMATRIAAATPGPFYIRISAEPPFLYTNTSLTLGKAITIRKGKDAVVVTTGAILNNVCKAAELLKKKKINLTIVHMPTVKPIDTRAIDALLRRYESIFVVEEHGIIGGLGSAVAEHASEKRRTGRIVKMGIPDTFSEFVGSKDYLRDKYGLSPETIAKRVERELHKQ